MRILFRDLIVWIAALCAAVSAQAQSTEAARYVNPQGIEVIQARRPVAEEAGLAKEKSAPAGGKVIQAGAVRSAGAAPQLAADSKLQVSAREQNGRDTDRMAILRDELAREELALANKLKILQTPAMKAKLNAEELARLMETMTDHEKNMRALSAEIGRIRFRP